MKRNIQACGFVPLACLHTCADSANPPRNAPTTVAGHFKMKLQQSDGK